MAQTISFSSGGFSTSGTGVAVNENPDGSFTLIPENTNAPIQDLTLVSEDGPLDTTILSETGLTLRNFTADLGAGDDRLIVGGRTNGASVDFGADSDTFETQGAVRNTEADAGAGNDSFIFETETRFAAVNSQFDMGSGRDTLVFGGNVRNVDVNLGSGSDTVEFQGNIRGANLNLGNEDGQVDTVRIAADSNIKDLVITGADDSDLLFIGSTQFNYDSENNLWVNATNSSDFRNFS